MKVFEYINKLALFHTLVMQERTGTPHEFAERLGVDRATVYNICSELRSHDIEIEYSRLRQTFYYKYPHLVEIRLIIRQHNDCANDKNVKG
ncbi:MAG: hypothetical protein LBE11_05085 [Prevotellaceae bacterium]|nr:hypothetical protein [Prevotellaceae bacterium]